MAINARIGWLSLLVATGAAQAATLEGSVRVAGKGVLYQNCVTAPRVELAISFICNVDER